MHQYVDNLALLAWRRPMHFLGLLAMLVGASASLALQLWMLGTPLRGAAGAPAPLLLTQGSCGSGGWGGDLVGHDGELIADDEGEALQPVLAELQPLQQQQLQQQPGSGRPVWPVPGAGAAAQVAPAGLARVVEMALQPGQDRSQVRCGKCAGWWRLRGQAAGWLGGVDGWVSEWVSAFQLAL